MKAALLTTSRCRLLAAGVCLLFAAGGCGGTSDRTAAPAPTPTSPTAPTPPPTPVVVCTYVPDSADGPINAAGGTASAAVKTPAACRWTAAGLSPADSWLVIAPGTSVGPAVLSVGVQPNRSFTGRSGTIAIRDEGGELLATHMVTQRGAGCLYRMTPEAQTLNAFDTYDGAGDNPVRVQVHAQPADCQWTARSLVPWMRIVYDSAAGTGDRNMYLSLDWNRTGSKRIGEIVVAGLSGVNPDGRHVVTQNGQ
jgi:hypothetical protein